MCDRTAKEEGLNSVSRAGGSLVVISHVTGGEEVFQSFEEVFREAVRCAVSEGRFRDLFNTNVYPLVIKECDEEMRRKWIVFHLQEKRFKEAQKLIEQEEWRSTEEYGDDVIAYLRDYVIDVLNDDQLLGYLPVI